MKRAFVVHGWGGFPEEGWFPWLKKELEAQGYQVFIPAMPDTDHPKIEDWVTYLAKIVGEPNKETFFVGHSVGCQAILRYAETLRSPVGGAVFVAGWFTLENMEDEEEETIAKPWIETPLNLDAMKTVLPKSTLIISDDDPYGAFEENKEKFTELGSKIVVLHHADHINGESGHTQLPEVLSEIERMSQGV